MGNIGSSKTGPRFFPHAKKTYDKNPNELKTDPSSFLKKNNPVEKRKKIDVSIPTKIMDFGRIKKAVYNAPDRNEDEKIEELRQQIKEGSYKIDYEGLADKMIRSEF